MGARGTETHKYTMMYYLATQLIWKKEVLRGQNLRWAHRLKLFINKINIFAIEASDKNTQISILFCGFK